MAINESDIMGRLQAYAKTASGKRRMKECIENAQSTGKPLANGTVLIGKTQMTEMANALANMIRRRLPESISQIGDTLSVSEPTKNPDGSYEVVLHFDRNALHRDSLENDLGYDGIDNIVALFNNGYHARNYVYGWWNGHKASGESMYRSGIISGDYAWVRSKKEREPLQFMQDAASEFNSKYGTKYDVTVQLGIDYIKE